MVPVCNRDYELYRYRRGDGSFFHVHVSPKIPLKLSKAYYALATAHAALGTIAEIAALYALLAAGTDVLPASLRMTDFKTWMRGVLIFWWLELLLGLALYVRWYVPHS